MRDLIKLINQVKLYRINGLHVRVQVTDVRQVWGRSDAQISPIEGSGSIWVSIDSLT